MNTKKVFAQSLVDEVVAGLGAMGINADCTNKDLLDCAIDEIRKIKSSAKEALKEQDAADKKVKDTLRARNIRQIVIWECTVKKMKSDEEVREARLVQIDGFLHGKDQFLEI